MFFMKREETTNSIEFQKAWENQANAYNAISRYLEPKGIDLNECMGLIENFRKSTFDYISFLFNVNKVRGVACVRNEDV